MRVFLNLWARDQYRSVRGLPVDPSACSLIVNIVVRGEQIIKTRFCIESKLCLLPQTPILLSYSIYAPGVRDNELFQLMV